eukprot:jgi/Phyca11/20609/fgenesh1_pg.PHYCAscaffold_67_\
MLTPCSSGMAFSVLPLSFWKYLNEVVPYLEKALHVNRLVMLDKYDPSPAKPAKPAILAKEEGARPLKQGCKEVYDGLKERSGGDKTASTIIPCSAAVSIVKHTRKTAPTATSLRPSPRDLLIAESRAKGKCNGFWRYFGKAWMERYDATTWNVQEMYNRDFALWLGKKEAERYIRLIDDVKHGR